MLQMLTKETIGNISNPIFADYAARYLDIYDGFAAQVEAFGLPFAQSQEDEIQKLYDRLLADAGCRAREPEGSGQPGKRVVCRNGGASLVYGDISDACAACRTGADSYTGFISLRCHRDCYFCFNPNQDEYDLYSRRKKDWERELEWLHARQKTLRHIALTGGEPLLYKDDTVAYFKKARSLWPDIYMRLYTSGDLLDEGTLKQLRETRLNEIRFSLKLEDPPERMEQVYKAMALAREYIPAVMVEMPVLPDSERAMCAILDRLEELEIFGINLLEFCFPFNNAEMFRSRGYALRWPPYKTLYNFWYAGGLPVAGSELLALKLLDYAVKQQYRLNVHYCSLENKHFGQIYMQNTAAPLTDPTYCMSQRDFYLKTVKAFGPDAGRAEQILKKHRRTDYRMDRKLQFIQMSPSCAKLLQKEEMELGISYNVREYRDGEICTRELRIDRWTGSGKEELEDYI